MARARKNCHAVASVATVASLLIGGSAFAQSAPEFEVGEGRLGVMSGEIKGATELPCTPATWAGDAERFYGACPSGGLLVVDVSQPGKPRPVEVVVFDSPVKRVFTLQGDVWFELANGAARPLVPPEAPEDAAPPEEPEDIEEPVDEPTESEEELDDEVVEEVVEVEETTTDDFVPLDAKIVERNTDSVVIDRGKSEGVVEGQRFAILVEDVRMVAGDEVKQERELGVGSVTTVTENHAVVDLPLNVIVPADAFARSTRRMTTSNRFAPDIVRGVSQLNVNVRPFLALGTLGGGAVMDANYSYRFDAPVAVDVKLSPFAFGVARDGNILTFAGNAFLSYDTRLFQVGLGAGVSQVSEGRRFFVPESEGEPDTTTLGFSAAQFIRLGSPEGLNVEVVNNFVLIDEEFDFGGIDVKVTVPTSTILQDTWLIVRGGGGVPGYAYGEVGIRVLASGNGGPGSVFLLPTVGFVSLEQEEYEPCEDFRSPDGTAAESGFCSTSQTAYGGPMVGFGVDWRF